MKYQQKLAQLAEKELPHLMNKLIIQDDCGFDVFGKYRIEKTNRGYAVKNSANNFGTFRHTRTALAWCIADNLHDYNLASRIVNLENISVRYHNDIECRSGIAHKTSSGSQWETINHKLSRRQQQVLAVDSELEKCINKAKYYQIRGFSNETN